MYFRFVKETNERCWAYNNMIFFQKILIVSTQLKSYFIHGYQWNAQSILLILYFSGVLELCKTISTKYEKKKRTEVVTVFEVQRFFSRCRWFNLQQYKHNTDCGRGEPRGEFNFSQSQYYIQFVLAPLFHHILLSRSSTQHTTHSALVYAHRNILRFTSGSSLNRTISLLLSFFFFIHYHQSWRLNNILVLAFIEASRILHTWKEN